MSCANSPSLLLLFLQHLIPYSDPISTPVAPDDLYTLLKLGVGDGEIGRASTGMGVMGGLSLLVRVLVLFRRRDRRRRRRCEVRSKEVQRDDGPSQRRRRSALC